MNIETQGTNVLIIGGSGLVGAHVATALGDRAVVTYRSTAFPGGVPLDLLNAPRTRALITGLAPSTIVLAAAEAWVERCEREPEETRRLNVDAANTVIEAARAVGALLVVFSSEYVFDGANGRYYEHDIVRPVNEYGRQKVALEELTRQLPRHLICRTSGVYGWARQRKNFVCQLLDTLRAGRDFIVPSDQMITPTYAVDLARTLTQLIALGATGTVHLVGPQVMSRLEFARTICAVFGLPTGLISARPTGELGLAARRPKAAGLADDRMRSLVGPLTGPAEALAHMKASERELP